MKRITNNIFNDGIASIQINAAGQKVMAKFGLGTFRRTKTGEYEAKDGFRVCGSDINLMQHWGLICFGSGASYVRLTAFGRRLLPQIEQAIAVRKLKRARSA